MKKLPNIITLSRIAVSLLLLLSDTFGLPFFVFYIYCGLSDIADGFAARRLKAKSSFGAGLDSAADCIFALVLAVKIMSFVDFKLWTYLWIGAIFVVKISTLATGFAVNKKVGFLHTYLNKASGFCCFLSPLLIKIIGTDPSAVLLCTICTLSSSEELCITAFGKNKNADVRFFLDSEK